MLEARFVRQRRELGSTGIMVSPVGFGASPLGSEFGNIDVRYFLH
jgi:aryl-alcohol dehydrogenase-like predicted oxidoreductase